MPLVYVSMSITASCALLAFRGWHFLPFQPAAFRPTSRASQLTSWGFALSHPYERRLPFRGSQSFRSAPQVGRVPGWPRGYLSAPSRFAPSRQVDLLDGPGGMVIVAPEKAPLPRFIRIFGPVLVQLVITGIKCREGGGRLPPLTKKREARK